MILDENIGLAKVSKEDHGEVNQTYASAIRDIEKAEEKEAEFTKTQAEPKRDEKPKNPKMVPGAKKMHLDESLFEEDCLEEKKQKSEEEILDDLYDTLRRAKYLVNADPVGYRISKKQPEGQVQISRKDKSYELIKDEKDLEDAKRIVDKFGFDSFVKTFLGTPSLYIDVAKAVNEEVFRSRATDGGEMSFDIKDDGTIIIYDGDKIIKQSKTNPTYAKQVLKDLGFEQKEIIREDIESPELTAYIERLNKYMYDYTDALKIERPADPFTVEELAEAVPGAAGFDEDADQIMSMFNDDPLGNEELIRLIRENRWLKQNFESAQELAINALNKYKLEEDFYDKFNITPERKVREVYTEIDPEEYQLDRIHPEKTIADIWSEMQAGEDFYRIASVDGEGFDSAVREGMFEIISKAFKIPYDTVYLTWRNGGKLEETFKEDSEDEHPEEAKEKVEVKKGEAFRVRIGSTFSHARRNYYDSLARTLTAGGVKDGKVTVNMTLTSAVQHSSELTFLSKEEAKKFIETYNKDIEYTIARTRADYTLYKIETDYGEAYVTSKFVDWYNSSHKQSKIKVIKESFEDEHLGISNQENSELENIIDFLSTHETAFEDFKNYFNPKINKWGEVVADNLNKEEVIDWLRSHTTLYKDYLNHHRLKEDVEAIPDSIQPGPEAGLAAELTKLIKEEWDAIQDYNDAIVTAELEGYHDIAKVFKDIVNEENLHVGQLEECMKTLSPNAESIEQGEVEASEQLNEVPHEEMDEDPEEGMHY